MERKPGAQQGQSSPSQVQVLLSGPQHQGWEGDRFWQRDGWTHVSSAQGGGVGWESLPPGRQASGGSEGKTRN